MRLTGKTLTAILALVLASAAAHASIPKPPTKTSWEMTYHVEVPKPRNRASFVKVWIPIPAESAEQKILNKRITTPVGYEINTEKRSGSRMIYLELGPRTQFPVKLTATYQIERTASERKATPAMSLYKEILFNAADALVLEPRQRAKPLRSFLSPYVEINGKPSQGYKREVSVRKLRSS